jgi:hypothetical protein
MHACAIVLAPSFLALCLAGIIGPPSAWAEENSALGAFVDAYRCAIIDIITRIHEQGDVEQNRFFILSVEERPSTNYVQCVFEDARETRMYCEAASGFFEHAPGEPRDAFVSSPTREALGRLGFSTDDSKGNFAVEIDIAGAASYGAVADLVLEALYLGYETRAHSIIEVHSPILDEPELLLPMACPLVSQEEFFPPVQATLGRARPLRRSLGHPIGPLGATIFREMSSQRETVQRPRSGASRDLG